MKTLHFSKEIAKMQKQQAIDYLKDKVKKGYTLVDGEMQFLLDAEKDQTLYELKQHAKANGMTLQEYQDLLGAIIQGDGKYFTPLPPEAYDALFGAPPQYKQEYQYSIGAHTTPYPDDGGQWEQGYKKWKEKKDLDYKIGAIKKGGPFQGPPKHVMIPNSYNHPDWQKVHSVPQLEVDAILNLVEDMENKVKVCPVTNMPLKVLDALDNTQKPKGFQLEFAFSKSRPKEQASG